jgi:hypothetical protein
MNKFLLLALSCLLAAGSTVSAQAERVFLVMPHRGIEVFDTSEPGPLEKAAPGTEQEALKSSTITFNLTYEDPADSGFNDPTQPERKQRLRDALDYVAEVINMPGTLDVKVKPCEYDGTGAVAFAGTYFASSTAGFSSGFALMRLSTGDKPNPAFEEIQLTVDFGHDVYTGLGSPAVNQLDLLSVLVHEFTHGLGFASLVQSNGKTNQEPGGQQAYTVFDSLVWRKDPTLNLFSGIPVVFHGTAADLISEKLEFRGTNATSYYGFGTPGLYAPNPFVQGSSIQHWFTDQIIGGAVMEHQFVRGVPKRRYAPVDIGALRDLGYVNAEQTGEEGEGEGIEEGEGTEEGEGEGEGEESPPYLTVTPYSGGQFQFAEQEVATTAEQVFQVSNTGGDTLSGVATVSGTGFVLLGTVSYSLGAGDTPAQARVRFTPPYAGNFVGTLQFTGGENGPVTITLRGTGVDAPEEGEGLEEGEGEGEPPQNCNCGKTAPGLPDPGQVFLGALSLLVMFAAGHRYHFRV